MWRESFIITRRSAFISSQERLGFQQPHSAPYLTRGSPLPTQARSRWARSSRRFSQRQNPAQSASLPPIQSSHTHGPTGRPICCTRSTSLTSGSIKGGRSSPAAGPTDREQGKAHRPRSGLRIHLFPLLPDRHAWGGAPVSWDAWSDGARCCSAGRRQQAGAGTGRRPLQRREAAKGAQGAQAAGRQRAGGGRAAGRQRGARNMRRKCHEREGHVEHGEASGVSHLCPAFWKNSIANVSTSLGFWSSTACAGKRGRRGWDGRGAGWAAERRAQRRSAAASLRRRGRQWAAVRARFYSAKIKEAAMRRRTSTNESTSHRSSGLERRYRSSSILIATLFAGSAGVAISTSPARHQLLPLRSMSQPQSTQQSILISHVIISPAPKSTVVYALYTVLSWFYTAVTHTCSAQAKTRNDLIRSLSPSAAIP